MKPETKKEKRGRGRPSKLTPEVKAEICQRIADGESLRKILASDTEKFPARQNVMLALNSDAEFRDQYTRAREDQADFWAEEIVEIADDGSRDTYEDDDGIERTNHDVIQRSRLRVDTRKWLASKLKPKKYGDKVEHEHSGKVGVEHTAKESLFGKLQDAIAKRSSQAAADGELVSEPHGAPREGSPGDHQGTE